MSQQLMKNKDFLRLILSTSRDQAAALIDTITPEQLLLIAEISYNLLHLPLSKKPKHLVNKKKLLFRRLADKQLSKDKKRQLIRRNYKHILLTLWAVKPQLEQLL